MAESSEKKGLSPKAKKIINIVVDVVCGLILVVALIFAISTISSRAKGYDQYTEIFGKAYLAVQSDSMAKDYETGEVKKDNFAKGDLIVIKTLKSSQAKKLKVGDIITFQTIEITGDGKMVLNTHRIVEIVGEDSNGATAYRTHGDNNPEGSTEVVLVSDVVGIYQGKASGIGKVAMFMGSTGGFVVFVLIPTLIIVAIAATNLVIVIKKERKVQVTAAEDEKLSEREKMRAELLAEMGIEDPKKASEEKEQAPPAEEVEEATQTEQTEDQSEDKSDNTK